MRRDLGVLPAVAPVDGRLTGRQNLRFVADLYRVDADDAITAIDGLLETFGLADRADERVEGYSTGLRQRLGLARVLLPDPSVLLLDEPTASLDPVAARRVRNLIAGLGRSQVRTIVICTHDLVEAQELCDRVVVLEHGRIIAEGPPAELAADIDTNTVAIRVDPRHVQDARRILAENETWFEPSTGATLDVSALTPGDVAAAVRSLVVGGVDVHAVMPHEPSLEDVYLALHGEDCR